MVLQTRIVEREAKRKRREEPFTGCAGQTRDQQGKQLVEALLRAVTGRVSPINSSTGGRKEEVRSECGRGMFAVRQPPGASG